MKLRKTQRKNVKIKLGLRGPSNSGKTYSSILFACGLADDMRKVAVIDTENKSSDLYSHLGDFNVIDLKPPFSPQRYIEAIELAEKEGMEVIVLDNISHCWNYLLELHASIPGNSFTNWGKITPKQNEFINKILQSDSHIIATMRVKEHFVLTQRGGKYIPEKVGLKPVQRNGMDYEFTTVLELDADHMATAVKDRTGLFQNTFRKKISVDDGNNIKKWCHSGVNLIGLKQELNDVQDITFLKVFCDQNKSVIDLLKPAIIKKQNELKNKSSNLKNFSKNGTSN